jgi:diguanylate cyclase (GGDEF)-like protein
MLAEADEREPLSLAVLDVDDFKRVNDEHGHAMGDTVLRHVADRLLRSCRETDLVYRFGGEEFVLLLPATGPEAARRILERVHDAVREARADVPSVTVSAGIAAAPLDAEGADELYAAADAALYAAKRDGKDRTSTAGL